MTGNRTPQTSLSLRQVANQLRAGRHPLVTGTVGDLVLLQGQPMHLGDALERMGTSSFDVVIRINAADGLVVVKGKEAYGRLLHQTSEPAPDAGAGDLPERERRARSLRDRGGSEDTDPIVAARRCLAQDAVSVMVVLEQADILLQDPAHHDQPDRTRVAQLQLALREGARVGAYRNTCVLVAGQHRSIPPVLLAGSEDVAVVGMEAPTRDERAAFLTTVFPSMQGSDSLQTEDARRTIIDDLAILTDGDSLQTLASLAAFSASGKHSVLNPRALVNLHRFGERPDYWAHLLPRLREVRELLTRRVFGQPHAIDAVMGVLAAGALGLDISGNPLGSESQPRGILWFVGSTGVGKTELAKAIAEAVFGDPEAYTRFDMSTFAESHAAERLMGAPPGFVGFEQGGELTNAVRRRPNCVVLLDEIEKANPVVLDRFMSIFDDGRVTDAQGRVTHFGETIIIATTNVGAHELGDLVERSGGDLTFEQIRDVSVEGVRRHLMSLPRPELFGRIEAGIVAFDILRDDMIDRIAMKIAGQATLRHGPRLEVDTASALETARAALSAPAQRALGGRQLRNVFQRRFRELATWLVVNGHTGARSVQVSFAGGAMFVGVDGGPAQRAA